MSRIDETTRRSIRNRARQLDGFRVRLQEALLLVHEEASQMCELAQAARPRGAAGDAYGELWDEATQLATVTREISTRIRWIERHHAAILALVKERD